jgi:hypothetical protein
MLRIPRTVSLVATAATVLALGGFAAVTSAASATPRSNTCASAQLGGTTRVGHFAGLVRPVGTGSCATSIPTDPHAPGGTPPLLYHNGPVMATPAVGDQVVVTPIYWAGAGYSFASNYESLINRYLADAAHDSEKSTNVFSTLFEYSGSNGAINYRLAQGTPILDSHAFPTSGCTVNSGSIYSDGTGYTKCLDDAQVQTEINSVVTAHSLTRDLGHMYVMFLPKHVEACFYAGNPSNQACTINSTPSAAFCAYHSEFSGNTVYANMPFPIYESATGYSCTKENLGTSRVQSPNGNPDADVEISPLSHEMSEAITDPDTQTGWYDSSGYENGDECAYKYGALSGTDGGYYNQTINGHHYLTQEEFSNHNFNIAKGGCLQHFVAFATPSIKSMSSHSGTHAGGLSVTISGVNFAATTSVKFGTAAATFTLIDSKKLQVTTPAHAAGTVDVRVTTGAGTSAIVSADKYTFT